MTKRGGLVWLFSLLLLTCSLVYFPSAIIAITTDFLEGMLTPSGDLKNWSLLPSLEVFSRVIQPWGREESSFQSSSRSLLFFFFFWPWSGRGKNCALYFCWDPGDSSLSTDSLSWVLSLVSSCSWFGFRPRYLNRLFSLGSFSLWNSSWSVGWFWASSGLNSEAFLPFMNVSSNAFNLTSRAASNLFLSS